MKNLNIIYSKTEPNKNKFWFDGTNLKYFSSNGWKSLGGGDCSSLKEDINDLKESIGTIETVIDTINGEMSDE